MLIGKPWTCRTQPRNPYPPLQQCCQDSRYPGAPEKRNPKTFPRALPQQQNVSLRCGGKSRWFGFDVAYYFSSSPTLEIDTLSHIPLRGSRWASTVEYSRRHLSARAETITLSLQLLFFFFFLHMYSTSVPLTLLLGSAPVVSLTSSAGIRRGS